MAKELSKKTEEKLIEVATELFAKDGYNGASIREICKKAGVNISLISYYFGGKKELYAKIVTNITGKIINYMRSKMGIPEEIKEPSFDHFAKEEKIAFLFKAIDNIMNYFYEYQISDYEIMIFFREQITSEFMLNAMGYRIFRRLIGSIIGKDENDKEVIFRCLTIMGQIQAPRVLKQFSLDIMNQSGYSKEDVQMLKHIITSQIRAILNDAMGEEN